MPQSNTFTTTASQVSFLDRDGDRMRLTGTAEGAGQAVIRIAIGGPGIIMPVDCIDELIEGLNHLKRRALECAGKIEPITETPA